MQPQRRSSGMFAWLIAFVVVLLLVMLAVAARSAPADSSGDLALVGGKVYPTPQAAPIKNAVVLIHDGKIAAVAERDDIEIPKSAFIVECAGRVITAGFWNSHVHFTEDAWKDAPTAPAAKLEEHMQTMLTKWGDTTVFDIGSFPQDTLALRRRVESGEIAGPKIYTTAGSIFPKDGIPFYIPKDLASQLRPFEAATPADAARLAKQSLAMGGDGIKLFTGAIMGHGKVTPMPVDVVRAAVEVAHAAGKPVFAHPSNHVGTDNALAGGVDILAHTIAMEDGWTPDELQRMKESNVALIPTLSLFPDEVRKEGGSDANKSGILKSAVAELKSYFDKGGTILFGTDVGYTQLYDTTSEYDYMGRAGMNWRDILASLTTNPATFFKAGRTGKVVNGYDADLVVLAADPATDVRNFAKVEYTIRAGKVIYKK
ncbi:MAG TPA: amidohydrolase family protein [Terriglobales bacterium]|nr:amidohydrolase family protein [Terriglobales bacterium]